MLVAAAAAAAACAAGARPTVGTGVSRRRSVKRSECGRSWCPPSMRSVDSVPAPRTDGSAPATRSDCGSTTSSAALGHGRSSQAPPWTPVGSRRAGNDGGNSGSSGTKPPGNGPVMSSGAGTETGARRRRRRTRPSKGSCGERSDMTGQGYRGVVAAKPRRVRCRRNG